MAFSETEKATLVEILGIRYSALDTHLDYVVLTTEVEDAIQSDVSLWDDYRNVNDVDIHPTESNFGAEINGAGVRNAIRTRVANWLELDISISTESWARTERA